MRLDRGERPIRREPNSETIERQSQTQPERLHNRFLGNPITEEQFATRRLRHIRQTGKLVAMEESRTDFQRIEIAARLFEVNAYGHPSSDRQQCAPGRVRKVEHDLAPGGDEEGLALRGRIERQTRRLDPGVSGENESRGRMRDDKGIVVARMHEVRGALTFIL